MSTDSFNLAPAQSTAAGAPTLPGPSPYGAAPHPSSPAPTSAPRKRKPVPAADEGSVAGVVIPGAVLTGLISLCWLIHQFGLPAVILGVMACAAAATAALALKARKGAKRVSGARKAAVRAAGGGSPGGSVLGPRKTPKSPRTASGSPAGSRRAAAKSSKSPLGSGGASGSPKRPAGGARTAPGKLGPSASTVKPAGSLSPAKTSPKKPAAPVPRNSTGTLGNLLSRRAPAPGSRPGPKDKPRAKPTGGRTLLPGKKTPGAPAKPTAGKPTAVKPTAGKNGSGRTPGQTTAPTGKAGRLSRIAARKAPAPAPGNALKGSPKTLTGPNARKLGPQSKAARANTLLKKTRRPKPAHLKPKVIKTTAGKKNARHAPKGKHKLVTHKPTAHMDRMRRLTYLAGVKLRKHTSKKTRMRIRRVISPTRTALRTTGRVMSKPLAYAVRYGTKSLLALHMQLGTLRYTHAGPNWARPLAKVLHALTSPAARALAATGAWAWLNKWMYRHTSAPTTPTTPQPIPQTTAPAPAQNDPAPTIPHQPVSTPAPTTTGAAPMTYAAPLEQAADAVRQAGAMLLTSPAENMVGYEQTLHALATLQEAIGEVVRHAGETTRENFKVNPAIAEAYDDTASYASNLAQRLTEIPVLFRQLHEEQIENIENPTVQARKWDIAANE